MAVLTLLREIEMELYRARELHPAMRTTHEAYAVILEEVDEFWQIVKMKQHDGDGTAMRQELIQVAAMALRAILDLELR